MFIIILFFLFSLLSAHSALALYHFNPPSSEANSSITISGTVEDSATGELLIGAHVIYSREHNLGAYTNFNGRFTITIPAELKKERHYLEVSYLGYLSRVLEFSGDEISQDLMIKLAPASGSSEALTITAPRILSEDFAIVSLDPIEVYLTPSSWGDPLLALTSQPSVTNTDESASIAVRGTSSRFTTVYFNGVPIRNAVRFSQVNGLGVFSIFNTELVREISLFPGNPPLEFGNTNAGIVSVESMRSVGTSYSSTLNFNTGGGSGYFRMPLTEKLQVDVLGDLQSSYLLTRANPGAFEDLNRSASGSAGLQATYLSDRGAVTQTYLYGLNEDYDYQLRLVNSNGRQDYQSERLLLVMNHLEPIGDWIVGLDFSYQTTKNEFEYKVLDFNERTKSFYTSADLSGYVTDKIKLKWGITAEQINYSSQGVFNLFPFQLEPGSPVIQADSSLGLTYSDTYVYATYKASEKWFWGFGFRPGARFDKAQHYLSGQFSVNFRPRPSGLVRFSAGQYHQFDTPFLERPQVLFSQSRQITLDFEQKYTSAQINMSVFFNSVNCRDCSPDYRIYGSEFSSAILLNSNVTLQNSITALRSLRELNGKWISSAQDTRLFVNSGFVWQITPALNLNAAIQWREGRPYTPVINKFRSETGFNSPVFGDPNSRRLSAYFRSNATMSYMFSFLRVSGVWFVTANNLTDRKNVQSLSYSNDFNNVTETYLSRRFFVTGFSIRL